MQALALLAPSCAVYPRVLPPSSRPQRPWHVLPPWQGIRELELKLSEAEHWPEAAFLLGTLRPTLRRLSLAAPEAAELPAGGAAFLCCLRGLTSLDLDNCLASLGPSIGQLGGLRELLVSREDLSYDFELPQQLGALTALTRLELVRCVRCFFPLFFNFLMRPLFFFSLWVRGWVGGWVGHSSGGEARVHAGAVWFVRWGGNSGLVVWGRPTTPRALSALSSSGPC